MIQNLQTIRTIIENAMPVGPERTQALQQIDDLIAAQQQQNQRARSDAENNFNEIFTIAGQAQDAINQATQASQQNLQNTLDLLNQHRDGTIQLTDAQQEQLQQQAIQQKAELDANNARNKILQDTQAKLKDTIGLGYEMGDSFLGSMVLAGGGFAEMGAAIMDAMQPAKLFGSALMQVEKATMELFTSFDQAQAQLARTTGTTGEYNDMLYQVQEQNRSYNVDVKDAGAAIGDLHRELSTFNRLSSEQQMMLTETTARMKALGVSTQVGAQQFDNMIQGMGMTTSMANEASMEMVALGDSIGMAADQLSEGFNSAASELAKYGPGAIDVFKGMAAAAKSTGIEMGTLMGITKQFDTFEGAAQSAGKLNAILGGGVVNSMDLLNATEEERVRMLIQSMSLSGKNFESLNRFEKQAIASAAGISDMTEANKLFSMSLSAYDDMQSKAAGASAESAKLQERAQAATELGDKLKQIGQGFAVAFMPILDFFHGFANIVLELNDMTGGVFIPTMVALVGIVYLLMNAQVLYNAAMSTANGLNLVMNILQGQRITQEQTLTLTQQISNLQTRIANLETRMLAGAMTQLMIAVAPLIPAIVSLGFAIGSIALAIAAPFIALTALIVSFTQLFTAMLEAPEAIAAAVAGLVGFAVAASAAMVIMAYGMAAAVTILVPFALQMMIVAPALMYFSLAVAVAAGAFYLIAVGLERMSEALKGFSDVSYEDMMKAATSLALFTLLLIPLAVPLAVIGVLVGLPLMLFGIGLGQFAKGLAEFNSVGYQDMFKAALGLEWFTFQMIGLALPLAVIGILVGLPLMLLGMGLGQFAKGLTEFNKVGYGAMFKAALSIELFTMQLIGIAVPLAVVFTLVALPLILFGMALLKFAEGIRMFRKVGVDDMLLAVASLGIMALLLIEIGLPLAVGALLVSIPLYMLGIALQEFGKGVRKFNAVGIGAILAMTASLFIMAALLNAVGLPLAAGALLVSIPLYMLGVALKEFAVGIAQFNAVGFLEILKMGAALGLLAGVLQKVAPQITVYGTAVALPLAAVAVSLGIFGKALEVYQGIDPVAAGAGLALVFTLGKIVERVGIQLATFAMPFAYGLTIASIGLAAFGAALQVFVGVGLDTVLVVIAALLGFGAAMGILINTGLLAYMIVGFYLLAIPLQLFAAGLMTMGMGLLLIQAGMPALMSLGDTLSVIAEIGVFGAAVMDLLALSVFGIALALLMIPESKTIAFGFAMQGYAAAMAAVSALTPESVEAAEKVVESAAEYAEIQATMRMPDEDSFIQAMKNVFGIGEGKDKQGQDIILQLNGRELGRAIDAAINRRHNLAID